MRNKTDICSGILVLGFCIIGWLSVRTLPGSTEIDLFGPSALPGLVLVLLAVCAGILILMGLRHPAPRNYWPDKFIFIKNLMVMGVFLAYLGGMVLLRDFFNSLESFPFQHSVAFSISTLLFLVSILLALGRRNPLEIGLVSAGTTGSLVFVFAGMFDIMLP